MNLTLEQAFELKRCLDRLDKPTEHPATHYSQDLYDLVTDEISFLEREEEGRLEAVARAEQRKADGWKHEYFEEDGSRFYEEVRRDENGDIVERGGWMMVIDENPVGLELEAENENRQDA